VSTKRSGYKGNADKPSVVRSTVLALSGPSFRGSPYSRQFRTLFIRYGLQASCCWSTKERCETLGYIGRIPRAVLSIPNTSCRPLCGRSGRWHYLVSLDASSGLYLLTLLRTDRLS